MKNVLYPVLAALLVANLARGQDREIDGGIARRLADVLGNVQVDDDKGLDLADLAAEVDLALIDVDPDQVARLNDELDRLRQEERDLIDRLGDVEQGLPVVMGPLDFREPVIGDLSEAALDLARAELNAQQAEIRRLERLESERQLRVEAERAARKATPLTDALLATLEDIPSAPANLESEVEEERTEFPLRVARALFASGDTVGALRHFRQVPAEEMTLQGRYEMARCLEEAGRLDEALRETAEIIARAPENDTFWKDRATALKSLIESSRNVRQLDRSR